MRPKVAIIDDYAHAALAVADWTAVRDRVEVTVFDRHLGEDEAAELLRPFDVICTMRERMAFPRTLIARLPNLKLLTIVGLDLPNLDLDAATEHGVQVAHPDFGGPRFRVRGMADGVTELTWALVLATARHLAAEDGGCATAAGSTPPARSCPARPSASSASAAPAGASPSTPAPSAWT